MSSLGLPFRISTDLKSNEICSMEGVVVVVVVVVAAVVAVEGKGVAE